MYLAIPLVERGASFAPNSYIIHFTYIDIHLTPMKRLSGLFLVFALSASAAFAQTAQTAETQSASTSVTTYTLQKTDAGYQVQSTDAAGNAVESTTPAAAPAAPAAAPAAPAAAGKSCCSKKGSTAAACSGKEGASAHVAAADGATPACCASGKHVDPKKPN